MWFKLPHGCLLKKSQCRSCVTKWHVSFFRDDQMSFLKCQNQWLWVFMAKLWQGLLCLKSKTQPCLTLLERSRIAWNSKLLHIWKAALWNSGFDPCCRDHLLDHSLWQWHCNRDAVNDMNDVNAHLDLILLIEQTSQLLHGDSSMRNLLCDSEMDPDGISGHLCALLRAVFLTKSPAVNVQMIATEGYRLAVA